MEKIYSRKKINLSKEYKLVLAVLITAILTVCYLVKTIGPTFNQLCLNEAKSVATQIVHETIDEVMEKYGYNDLVTLVKDKEGKIVSMQANIAIINKIISQISLKIQDKIDNTPNRDIYIRLGSFTGIKLLSGRGPKVPIRISSIGNINTEVMSEFTSTGINQSIHRIFTNITCKIEVLTPFNTISNEIEEKIILAENVIIGNIPENYLDIGKLLGENN
ncbi:MAG: sporulation protein YunB [Clostridia bacterium]|jgi:sporulation protein yunB|nr:sporulation protein YunB [Clostridium sp.]MEE0127834.1 sporulation protein YunB [Clostridia bacterium]HJJ11829.1 sporulation protein YunB [Clostridiaceae bacterium]